MCRWLEGGAFHHTRSPGRWPTRERTRAVRWLAVNRGGGRRSDAQLKQQGLRRAECLAYIWTPFPTPMREPSTRSFHALVHFVPALGSAGRRASGCYGKSARRRHVNRTMPLPCGSRFTCQLSLSCETLRIFGVFGYKITTLLSELTRRPSRRPHKGAARRYATH
jgi:hypothetical protein